MMNYIWSVILLASILYALVTGNLTSLGNALTESAGEAVEFVFALCGIMAMWSGLMEIAERTGLINSFSKMLLPFTKLLFPDQKNPETLSSIIMSFMSNIFGAGNSSTVFALRT
ncbi:MAG: nucleoside recognition domain-containing protein, partial [Anaerovoracaceae bacterium]|nr:nucleoside recognition domain-containing protein [Anaerovoracaceae bacterium]